MKTTPLLKATEARNLAKVMQEAIAERDGIWVPVKSKLQKLPANMLVAHSHARLKFERNLPTLTHVHNNMVAVRYGTQI